MCLVEIALMQAERRKEQQQLAERRQLQWREEGAALEKRRLKLHLTASYVAMKMGVSIGRLRRLEKGERVRERDRVLLIKSCENVLDYQEAMMANEELTAEVLKLRSQLRSSSITVEIDGYRWSIPKAPQMHSVRKRSVI